MEGLRVHKINGNYNEELREQIKGDLKTVSEKISKLYAEKRELEKSLLELDIEPFKIGGYALAEITTGRNKRWQKCLLECENRILYVRPVKEDGSLSGRHYSIFAISKPYSYYLKEVEE